MGTDARIKASSANNFAPARPFDGLEMAARRAARRLRGASGEPSVAGPELHLEMRVTSLFVSPKRRFGSCLGQTSKRFCRDWVVCGPLEGVIASKAFSVRRPSAKGNELRNELVRSAADTLQATARLP